MNAQKLFLFSRSWHRQAALLAALPLLITILTGLLLLVRGDFDWIQPKARTGSTQLVSPRLSFDSLLAQLRKHPQAGVQSWKDVSSVTFNPAKGIFQVRLKNNYEAQFDAQSGQTLAYRFRTSSLLTELHQGSFFHPLAMKLIFLPSGLLLLLLWGSGMVMYLFPALRRRRQTARPPQLQAEAVE